MANNNNMKKSISNPNLILDINEYIRFDKVEKGLQNKEEVESYNNITNLSKSYFNKTNKTNKKRMATVTLALPYNINNINNPEKNYNIIFNSIKIDNTVLPISQPTTPMNSPNKEHTTETLFNFY